MVGVKSNLKTNPYFTSEKRTKISTMKEKSEERAKGKSLA